MRAVLLALLVVPLLAACAGVRLLPAPPADLAPDAAVPGYADVRSWGDESFSFTNSRIDETKRFLQREIAAGNDLPNDGTIDVLLLSGGGSDGAYGAGLLNGWTDRGGRPEFWVVTGISTGALIAPFAFAGPEFDRQLELFYTNTRTDDLITLRLFDALTGSLLGLADTTSLVAIVDQALTPELLDRIAAEHARGRRLLIGTTNLDAQRPVVWDVGKIAASGRPDARRLIRDILLASSAIPGAMPPVQIEVEAGGRLYSEMHVDGGVTRQLFFLPPGLRLDALSPLLGDQLRIGTVYLLRNTKLAPHYAETEPGIVPITSRAISTLIKFSGVANVEVVREQARTNGFALKVTAVPEGFHHTEEEMFDPKYMRALYEVGYDGAFGGDPWIGVEGGSAVR